MKQTKPYLMMVCSCIIIVFLFSFIGCNRHSNERDLTTVYAVDYAESGSNGEAIYGVEQYSGCISEKNMIALLNSKQELVAFCDENEIPFYKIYGDDPYHLQEFTYNSALGRKIRSYDEAFFDEKSLILTFVVFPNIDPAKVAAFYIQGNDLMVEVARPEMNSFLDALSYHNFVIEIDKNSSKNKNTKLLIVRKGVTEDYLDENGKYI